MGSDGGHEETSCCSRVEPQSYCHLECHMRGFAQIVDDPRSRVELSLQTSVVIGAFARRIVGLDPDARRRGRLPPLQPVVVRLAALVVARLSRGDRALLPRDRPLRLRGRRLPPLPMPASPAPKLAHLVRRAMRRRRDASRRGPEAQRMSGTLIDPAGKPTPSARQPVLPALGC